ncbi:twin-arginine translocation signal domain-containing protein [Vibrio penaeicida]|uniref:twin-arginine translocation signal domain-containing protein n=1 Tax=Vibrio penaeicida TaxID=104609 RepID=UPI000CEA179E|nr:twin-arginine translocation signal domain-containing protein [Vibrio penaeicida]
MNDQNLSRRKFLKLSSVSAATALTLSLSGYSLAGQKWQMKVSKLNTEEANLLLALCRRIYPHPHLADFFYGACVESLDGQLSGDSLASFKQGLSTLNKSGFSTMSVTAQDAVLNKLSSEPFFQTVRGNMVVSLYNNPQIWAKFGYEGPSFSKGGYLHRGFDDIDWLPVENKEVSNG